MAASNESQGLKIAVAVFIALSVILSVTCYFLYTSYSQADAKLAAAVEKQNTQQKSISIQQTQLDELRGRIGVRAEARWRPEAGLGVGSGVLLDVDGEIGRVSMSVILVPFPGSAPARGQGSAAG